MNAALIPTLKAAIILATVGIAMVLPPVSAAGGTHISVGVSYNGGHYGHRYKHGYRHRNNKSHDHYGRGYSHSYRHQKPHGYHHYGYRGYNSGDVAAAALVGGLIGYGNSKYSYPHRYRVYRKPGPYHVYRRYGGYSYKSYVPTKTVVLREESAPAPPARILLKDQNGDCFQIHRNALGDEIRVHLPSHECNL